MLANVCFNSKTGWARFLLHFVLALVVALIGSCDDSDDPGTSPPAPNCKLVSSTVSQTGDVDETTTYTTETKFGYSYDDAGNQIASTTSYDYRTSAGYHQSSNSTRSNEFDKNGFLLRTVIQSSTVNADGSTNFQNSDYTYEYGQDRLMKQTVKSTVDGKTTNSVYVYEYDASGKVVKFYNRDTSAGVQVEYLGSKIVKITYVDEFGVMTSPYVEYNDKGLLVKSILTRFGDTEELRYQYNADGLVIRDERYDNTKPLAAAEYEYDTQEHPWKLVNGQPKGHPRIPNTHADPNYKHNITLLKSYSPDNNGAWQMISSSTYTYTYNAKGFPTNVIIKFLTKNGVEVGSSSTTYVYEDCQ